ncbi:MAG: CPBP family intramembrane metalloprotease [Clostridia bacterium]|nr:CPBP family intramembrane metalloprotease [Clostridia bacterium]
MKKQRSLFFDTSLIYFVVIVLFVGLRIFSNLVSVSSTVGIILNAGVQILFMLLIPFFMYKFLRKKKSVEVLKEFNVKPIGAKAVLYAILIGFIVYFLNLAVASFFNVFIYSTGYDPSFGMSSSSGGSYPLATFLLDVVVTAILPGICEEFCHRGLLVNGFKQLDIKKTVLLVGFLFGLMHLNVEQFFYASIIGMFLTLLVYITGSIIPSMIIHFMNNFMGLYLTFAQANKLPMGDFSSNLVSWLTNGNAGAVFIGIIFVIVIMLGILIFLVFGLMKSTRVKQFEKLARKAIAKKEREQLFEEFNLDARQVDADAGIEEDKEIPEVIINDAPRGGKRGVIIDINFSNNMLYGDNFIKKPSLIDKAFLYGTIFIGIFITLSTLIWGIM